MRGYVVYRLLAIGTLVLAGVHIAGASPASAAVRQCANPIAATGSHPNSEMIARREALISWSVTAKAYGEGFVRWQLAYLRSLNCTQGTSGYVCQAIGAPCTISQVPGRPRSRTPSPVTPGKQPRDI